MSTTQTTGICRFEWCDTDAATHAEDPTFHTRELGLGMMLAVDLEGKPYVNWMPDWSEWTATPDQISSEFSSVRELLANLESEFASFAKDVTK